MNFWAKKRKGDLVFESNLVLSQRGIRAMPHVIPQNSFLRLLLLPSPFQKRNTRLPVYRKLITWSTNAKRPVNLTWKLAIFRQEGIFNTFGFTFHVCHLIGFKMTSLITCRRSIRRKKWNKQKLVGNIWLYIIKYSHD